MFTNKEVKKEVRALRKWARQYHKEACEEIKRISRNASAIRYSTTKSNLTTRGYYCPNPMEDIILGNVSRGRLCDSLPSVGSSFEYFYDDEGLLRVINYLGDGEIYQQEILVYKEGEVFGLSLNDGEVGGVIHEVYQNGKIAQVVDCKFPFFSSESIFAWFMQKVFPGEVSCFRYDYQKDQIQYCELWMQYKIIGLRLVSVFQRVFSFIKREEFDGFRYGSILTREIYKCGYSEAGGMDSLWMLDLSHNPNNTDYCCMVHKYRKNIRSTFEQLHR